MSPFEIEFKSRGQELRFISSILQKLMSTVRDPVMVIKPDYTVVDVNDALLKALGVTRDEVIGKKCHELSHHSAEPCYAPLHECPLREVLQTQTSAHSLHEHHHVRSTRYYDVVAYPIGDAEGNVELILEIWRDISSTLEKELEKKAYKIKQDLAKLVHEDKMIALGKLVASAVHEINNPLSSIHTFCRVMLRMIRSSNGNLAPEEVKEMQGFIELMANESRRCGDIVSNLVSFSRHQKMLRQAVNLNDVIGKILLLLMHKMELQKIDFSVDLFPDLPCILGDLNQLQQVMMNLIFNAMEAMPTGGELCVRTCYNTASETVGVEVSDTGSGIAPETRQKIFEPFFSTKTGGAGVGLGLAVVYGIVKEHKGKIDVESEVGEGTCFKAYFPVVRQEV